MRIFATNFAARLYALGAAPGPVTPSEAVAVVLGEMTAFQHSDDSRTMMMVEEVSEDWDAPTGWSVIGGDSAPYKIIDTKLQPYAKVGLTCVFVDRNLNIAESELDDYEYILKNGAGGPVYLIWGTSKVIKTDFFTPQMEGRFAVYLNIEDTGSNLQ